MSRLSPSQFFPSCDTADRRGLIGIGGELAPQWLIDAYRHGIFPWPTQDGVLAWWSPDPRAIIEFGALHISRRLAQTIRGNRFQPTCDKAFADVMHGCAMSQNRADATWITPEILAAYQRLHRLGVAHSIEVWHDGQLAGGVYGVAIGAMFAAESMFYRVRDASKVALAHLLAHLQVRGYRLFDIQQLTPHTARLGASTISREQFLGRVCEAVDLPVTFGERLEVG